MKIHPLPSVDSQILYDTYQPLGAEEIFEIIVEAAASVGFPANSCNLLNSSSGHDIRVLCGDFHVLVTQSVPFENADHLNFALDTYSVKSTFPEASEIVEATGAYTQISVQKGVLPHEAMPKEILKQIGSELTAFCTSEESTIAMSIARDVTDAIVQKSKPQAVFWAPSLFFLKPETFSSFAEAANPNFLYMHPNLFGHKDQETGENLVGVVGSGAPALIGHALEFKPCPLPPSYMIDNMYVFLGFCQKRDALLPDGDVFGSGEDEKIQVIYHPTNDDRVDLIELKVVHNPALGIVQETIPTIQKHYDDDCSLVEERILGVDQVDLDPSDPVDAAILEQLAKQQKPEQAQQSPETTPEIVSSAPDASPQDENTQRHAATAPRQQRQSIQELREFALKAQQEPNDADTKRKPSGLLGKLFGKKLH